MSCFACGTEISLAAGERVGFREECSRCGADLHVCRNCRHHDPAAYNECRESSAERVSDRERSNRCDQFAPTLGPVEAAEGEGASEQARTALAALFKKT